jgi:hypothetical protein
MRTQGLISIFTILLLAGCQAGTDLSKYQSGGESVTPSSTPSPGNSVSGTDGITYSLTVPTSMIAGQSVAFTLKAKDSTGRLTSKPISTISFSSEGAAYGAFSPINRISEGVYSIIYTGRRAGPHNKIKVNVNGKELSQLESALEVVHADVYTVEIVTGNEQTAPAGLALPISPKLRVIDRYGNGIPNVSTQVDVAGGNGTFHGTTSFTGLSDSRGIIEAPWVLDPMVGTNLLRVTAQVAGSTRTPVTTLSAVGVAGAPAQLLAFSGDNQEAGHDLNLPNPLVVIAKDAFGNPVPNQNIEWSVLAGGTLGQAGSLTDSLGKASNPFTLGTSVGIQTVKAKIRSTSISYTFSITSKAIAFSYTWLFSPSNSNKFTASNSLSFTANSCQLSALGQEDSSATGGFTSGNFSGVVAGTLSDTITGGIKLGTTSLCDGTTTDCNPDDELLSGWTPQYPSLIGYWKLNGTPGSIANSASIGAAIGPSGSAKNTGMSFVAGRINQGIKFNGTNNYIDAGTPASFQSLSEVTIAGWIKPTVINNVQGLFGQELLYRIDLSGASSAGTLRFLMGKNGAWACDISSTLKVTANVWNHVVGTYNGTTAAIYINGVQAGTCAMTGSTGTNTNHFDIGAADLGTSPYSGTLDEVAVWNKGLTATEVATLYNRQAIHYSGTFTSRVIDAMTSQNWTSFSWVPMVPYLKALPDAVSTTAQTETSAGYPSFTGSVASSLEALYHFDGNTTLPNGSTFADNSGKSRTGTLSATTSTSVTYGPGVFGNAFSSDGNGTISASAGSVFATDFSVSFWALPTSFASENVIMTQGAYNANGFRIGTRGAPTASWSFWTTESAGTTNITSAATLNTWQHVVVTYKAQGSTSKLYVNGILKSSATGTYVPSTATTFLIGAGAGWKFAGSIDELAIWSRALDATETAQLYERGASRIKFQIRSCANADCSDSNWKGPDGTANTYFSELNNRTTQATTPSGSQTVNAPNMTLPNYTSPVASNRYFQYRAILETDAATTALMPELKSVAVGPAHYDPNSPTVVGSTGVPYYSLSNFVQTLGTAACSSGIAYNLGVGSFATNAIWYRWDASASSGAGAWVVSDGAAANATSAANIVAHLATFPANASRTSTVFIKAFLNSSGSTPCSLSSVKLDGFN